ncbi:hypothetical protein [Cupriavidus taiwanensis]|uniref:hypothetical protein n=1 Tax=Cupriavidus taiwanensis TaxID=164546 RepID=UPI0011AE3117|nr:hypothetical protein [Cupriavidus taiwanensis]
MTVEIPLDFPNDPFPAAVGGAQPKFATRVVDGTYVVGLTHEERVERYLMCADLVDQLSNYCRRKADEHPDWSQEALLNRMEKGIRDKQAVWNLGRSEVDWIVARVRAGEARVRILPKE